MRWASFPIVVVLPTPLTPTIIMTYGATLSGTLGDIEYLGPVTRFAVALADGAPLHLMALEPPSMSGAVSVAYDPRRVVVMGAPS